MQKPTDECSADVDKVKLLQLLEQGMKSDGDKERWWGGESDYGGAPRCHGCLGEHKSERG
ncbi:hypothetical protein PIB30_088027 [Stylosanthes scabra]|uniref:Uncharacterized protein n=1 Tax=Stylosanthes scabra TaxID=79078 RepID=A0ABU6USH5_9FABA|nr:hypothetical protein [Stylosanthes scabra]